MNWRLPTTRSPQPTGAIGVARVGDTWHAAVVDAGAAGDPVVVQQVDCPAKNDSSDWPEAWIKLSGKLDERVRRFPLALVLPPGAALHRRVTLPPADADTTRQLVAVRAEALLPGQAKQCAIGWSRDPDHAQRATDSERDGDNAWVTFVPERVLNQTRGEHADQPPATAQPAAFVSFPVALAAAQRRGGAAVAVGVTPNQTTLAHHAAGRLIEVTELDESPITSAEAPLVSDALLALPAHTSVAWCAPAAHRDALSRWDSPRTEPTPRAVEDLGAALARGAALAYAAPAGWPIAGLDELADAAAANPVSRRAWWVAAAAVVAALVLWVAADLYAGRTVTNARDAHPDFESQTDTLQNQLSLLNALELRPPTLLAMLDEFTEKIDGFSFQTLHYDADGDLQLTGQRKGGDQVQQLVTALADSRTLRTARLRNQSREGDQLRFEIVATPSDRFFEAFVTVKTTETEEAAGDAGIETGDASTAPDANDEPEASAPEDGEPSPDAESKPVEQTEVNTENAENADASGAEDARALRDRAERELRQRQESATTQPGDTP